MQRSTVVEAAGFAEIQPCKAVTATLRCWLVRTKLACACKPATQRKLPELLSCINIQVFCRLLALPEQWLKGTCSIQTAYAT